MNNNKKQTILLAPGAHRRSHACNSSYSGGRDQEDPGLKPAQANSSTRPCLEKPFTKIGLVEWLKVKALSSSPRTEKNRLYSYLGSMRDSEH
jgi:hypothetical protein